MEEGGGDVLIAYRTSCGILATTAEELGARVPKSASRRGFPHSGSAPSSFRLPHTRRSPRRAVQEVVLEMSTGCGSPTASSPGYDQAGSVPRVRTRAEVACPIGVGIGEARTCAIGVGPQPSSGPVGVLFPRVGKQRSETPVREET